MLILLGKSIKTFQRQFNSKKQSSCPKSAVGLLSLTYVPGLRDKVKRILNNFDIKVGMKPANALKHYFYMNDSTPLKLKKGVLYQVHCEDCEQSFIGETGCTFSTT